MEYLSPINKNDKYHKQVNYVIKLEMISAMEEKITEDGKRNWEFRMTCNFKQAGQVASH